MDPYHSSLINESVFKIYFNKSRIQGMAVFCYDYRARHGTPWSPPFITNNQS